MGNLWIDKYEINGVFVIDIKGRMDAAGDISPTLRHTVDRALTAGSRCIVFNLEGVTYIDSHALSALIESYTTIRKRHGNVGLAGLKGRALEIMVVTKLVSVFEVFPKLADAITSLRSRNIQC